MADPQQEPSGGGIFDSARKLSANLVRLLQTRIEIVSTEIEEERERLRHGLLLAILAGFCLGVATLLAVMFLVVLFWDTHRLVVIGVLFLLFAAAGIGCVQSLGAFARGRPRLFATTIDELAKDAERLRKSS